MSILVTGATGQLGYDVCKLLGEKAVAVSSRDFNLTDEAAVRTFVEKLRPEAVIHCAAYTAVDKAESEAERCFAVNAEGTRNLASAARDVGAKFLYVSTDYVFDGTLGRPYETDDLTNPMNVYGKSKLEGELAVRELVKEHFIVRTSWVFGQNGGNFVKTMLRLGGEGRELKVVDDQVGSPTYTVDLARLICDMIRTEKYGTYHATNSGYCSWYDFACEIFRQAGLEVKIEPVGTEDYPMQARRPYDSRLSMRKLVDVNLEVLPSWQDAVSKFLQAGVK